MEGMLEAEIKSRRRLTLTIRREGLRNVFWKSIANVSMKRKGVIKEQHVIKTGVGLYDELVDV